MPRRDLFHETVKRALVADGWVITHDPYLLRFGGRKLTLTSVRSDPSLRRRMGARSR